MAEADTKDRVPTEDELRSSDAPKPGGGGRSTSGLDMDSLLRDARGASDMPIDVKGIQSGLTNVSREKSAAGGALSDRVASRIEEDRGRMRRAQDATAIGPDELKPWNEKAEKAKYDTPPLEAFGSLASVFAIMASAFTHTPMVNALNGAAAAMNGIRDHDEKAYQSAYDAWKQNTNLALKRHEIQQQQYDNAGKMLQTDIAAGSAEMQMLAAKFNDKQVAVMIEHGMIKEVFELLQARQNAAMQMIKLQPEIENTFLKNEILEQDPEWKSNDPQRMKAAKDRVEAGKLTPIEQIYQQRVREKPNESAEDRADFYRDLVTKKTATPQQQALEQFMDDTRAQKGRDPTGEELRDFINTFQRGAGTTAGLGSVRRQAVEEEIEKAKRAGTPIDHSEALRRVKLAEQIPSGNRVDDLAKRVDLIDHSTDKITSLMGVLDRYPGAAGLFGRANRTVERIRNVFGSNDSDREQFLRDIDYLEVEAPRLLTDSSGRPLSAEAGLVGEIIGGKNWGDTTANTKRSLTELGALYKQMRTEAVSRRDGTWKPRDTGAAVPGQRSNERQPWLDAPVVE